MAIPRALNSAFALVLGLLLGTIAPAWGKVDWFTYRILFADLGDDRLREETEHLGRFIGLKDELDVRFLGAEFNGSRLAYGDDAKQRARALLREHDADMLLWGYIARSGSTNTAKLRAILKAEPAPGARHDYPDKPFDVDLDAPLSQFATDLAVVVYQGMAHKYPVDRAQLQWPMVLFRLGNALQYRDACQPSSGATTQLDILNDLVWPEQTDCDTTHLERAIAAYRDGLEAVPIRRDVLSWSIIADHYASALLTVGIRKQDAAPFEEAIAFIEAVLEANDDAPAGKKIRNAIALHGTLGTTWLLLAKLRRDAGLLARAEHHYRLSMSDLWSHHFFSDLGLANVDIARVELGGDPQLLRTAVTRLSGLHADYEDRLNLVWGILFYHRLGTALLRLGRANQDAHAVETAVMALQRIERNRYSETFTHNRTKLEEARALLKQM